MSSHIFIYKSFTKLFTGLIIFPTKKIGNSCITLKYIFLSFIMIKYSQEEEKYMLELEFSESELQDLEKNDSISLDRSVQAGKGSNTTNRRY